jgi:DNA-directed RNA polymerase subunit beta
VRSATRRTTRSARCSRRSTPTPDHQYIASTLDKDLTKTQAEALIEVYKKLRPGDPPTGENARQLVESLFFNFRRYDLGRVGRYKFDKKLDSVASRLGLELEREQRTVTKEDIAAIVGHLIECNRGLHPKDDIDHLGNRRIRANGELIQNAFRIGLLRMERVVRERMTIQEIDKATPNALINIRPVVAAMKEFFGGSQLSQFMDQTNPLAELTSKRRLSALGPGGLSRERAGFDVRDVHHSHYGRICPIETPEGPNIGLIGSLATYGRINSYGFIETPYRKVKRTVGYDEANLAQFQAGQDLVTKSGSVVLKAGEAFNSAAVSELKKQKAHAFPIRPIVTDDIEYLPADEEEEHVVAQANAPLDDEGHFAADRIPSRLPRYLPGGTSLADRVHGRVAQAGRVRGDGAHPVPRARRREPRTHGFEHAAPGGAAPRAGVADRRDGHGGARRARLRPGPGRDPRGRGHQRDRAAHRHRDRCR